MTDLVASATGPSAYWYLTRGSGAVALLLLTGTTLLGIASSNRWSSSRWPRFVVAGLHRNLTLLAIAFVALHVLTTVADGFAPIGLRDAILPFLSPLHSTSCSRSRSPASCVHGSACAPGAACTGSPT
jgi:sulfoxide reductase heme-binding subunit YedZ